MESADGLLIDGIDMKRQDALMDGVMMALMMVLVATCQLFFQRSIVYGRDPEARCRMEYGTNTVMNNFHAPKKEQVQEHDKLAGWRKMQAVVLPNYLAAQQAAASNII
ncbi:hypothetical protein DEU56DRAFT_751684 [Suillus clintonianus]|uniref:uncharacterized protein n=1 Tax=Suillus clintonianus TaxID=1904413 RepID=UPI001B88224A|nr:uncharacterized protein DEU56DRAFT_751684 [Suillus clintonianus]KAG2154024.1 hypothetical protein DEU56DRAFT_751684 [Suillus clintonianus]